jgi:hypothetical protein
LSTIWMPGEPRGEQQPPVLSRPPFVSSAGPEAVELARSAGLVLDPWQQFSLDVILAERSGDWKWAAFETGCLVARQNGKGAIIEALGLASLFLLDERLTLYGAHQFKTAQEHFLRMMSLIENTPALRKLCKKPRTSHGEEGFERLNGARFRFVARSRQSARGFTGDRLIVDEAQELSRSAMGAVLPTLVSRPNPQVNYFGTPPEESNDSEHWESVRDRGRTGDDATLAWLEWSSQVPDDLDSEVGVAQANPALGIRLTREAVQRERVSLDDEQFARERLTLWGSRSSKSVIDPDVWHGLEDLRSSASGQLTFGVDMPPNRAGTSIAVAGARTDGRTHVEIVEHRKGTGWVAGRLVELVEKHGGQVALDPSSPAGSLIPELQEAGIEPALISGREFAQACGAFYDAAMERRSVRHLGQPKLNVAVDAGRKRPLGDAWAWHRKDATSDISPLVAVTLALHVAGKPSKRRKKTGKAAFV